MTDPREQINGKRVTVRSHIGHEDRIQIIAFEAEGVMKGAVVARGSGATYNEARQSAGLEPVPDGEADCYEIVALEAAGLPWKALGLIVRRDVAIEFARSLLDEKGAVAASVQGRSSGRPVPLGETQVYRGVAAGYRPDGFWLLGAEDAEKGEIEVRPHA